MINTLNTTKHQMENREISRLAATTLVRSTSSLEQPGILTATESNTFHQAREHHDTRQESIMIPVYFS